MEKKKREKKEFNSKKQKMFVLVRGEFELLCQDLQTMIFG